MAPGVISSAGDDLRKSCVDSPDASIYSFAGGGDHFTDGVLWE